VAQALKSFSVASNTISSASILVVSFHNLTRRDLNSFSGVSYSTPIASFFETDAERALWNIASVPDSLNASSDAIPHAWGRARLLGQLAAQRDMSGILKYMTTDNVARDMLRITQKFGFKKLKYYGIS
jgi:hypothetical protein